MGLDRKIYYLEDRIRHLEKCVDQLMLKMDAEATGLKGYQDYEEMVIENPPGDQPDGKLGHVPMWISDSTLSLLLRD